MRRTYLPLSICLLTLNGCFSTSTTNLNEKHTKLSPIGVELTDLEIKKWPHSVDDIDLSSGFRFDIKLPSISHNDRETLYKNLGIDSWLITISKKGSFQKVAYMKVPFITLRAGKIIYPKVNKVYAQLNYNAAMVAPTHVKLKCPPYSHRKKLNTVIISNTNSDTNFIEIAPHFEKRQEIKVDTNTYNSNNFKAGYALHGTYYLDLALYDSTRRLVKSSQFRIPKQIDVVDESDISIKGCLGPIKNLKDNIIKSKKFRWKKE